MRIPKAFTLMGNPFNVSYAPRVDSTEELYGICKVSEGCIVLQDIGADLSPNYQAHVFCHELVHAMLDMVGEEELSNDESFVDTLGGLIHQFLETAEY